MKTVYFFLLFNATFQCASLSIERMCLTVCLWKWLIRLCQRVSATWDVGGGNGEVGDCGCYRKQENRRLGPDGRVFYVPIGSLSPFSAVDGMANDTTAG